MPVEIKVKRETIAFAVDETVRADSTVEKLATLKPVFDKEGTVTAGNASSINDAAAAVVLMERELAKQRGLRPLGRLVAYSYAGVDPKYMGIGPGAGGAVAAGEDRPEARRHRRVRGERGVCRAGAGGDARAEVAGRIARIRTAAAFRWAIRSARPDAFSRSRRCTS